MLLRSVKTKLFCREGYYLEVIPETGKLIGISRKDHAIWLKEQKENGNSGLPAITTQRSDPLTDSHNSNNNKSMAINNNNGDTMTSHQATEIKANLMKDSVKKINDEQISENNPRISKSASHNVFSKNLGDQTKLNDEDRKNRSEDDKRVQLEKNTAQFNRYVTDSKNQSEQEKEAAKKNLTKSSHQMNELPSTDLYHNENSEENKINKRTLMTNRSQTMGQMKLTMERNASATTQRIEENTATSTVKLESNNQNQNTSANKNTSALGGATGNAQPCTFFLIPVGLRVVAIQHCDTGLYIAMDPKGKVYT